MIKASKDKFDKSEIPFEFAEQFAQYFFTLLS
jgi:hypothetical protein